MDIFVIIYILIAFVLGCAIAWVVSRHNKSSEPSSDEIQEAQRAKTSLEGLQREKNELENELGLLKDANAQLKDQIQEKENSIANIIIETETSLKAKYEQLIQKIEAENKKLDGALKLATEGKIEESVRTQLLDAQESASKVLELDKELQNLRLKHTELLKVSEPLRSDLEQAKMECSKLIKKVKKLEDDVEEAEEEQESLEKKLKAKGAELQEANEQLEVSAREKKRLQTEIEQRENELSSRLNELKRKNGSIEFIQEILSAPETGAKDVKELYRAIDIFESFLRGQFMDCNAYLYNTYTSLSFNDISGRAGFVEKKKLFLQLFEEWASVKRKSWLDKKTTIAFVGEFSAGKTSIVNRILSQDNPKIPLLPVSAKATTAIPTYIAGGEAETYNFVTPNDKLKAINEEIFKKISKEVLDEIKGVSSLIKYFVMTYKNPNLIGLSILDTPGFNSNDAEDKARTIDVINECDALFWVFDVNAGTVNRSSISLIKEKLNKPLIVVINKVDTKSPTEVDKVESLIRKTLQEEGLNVEKFIRFSAKAPLEDIMSPIRSIKHDESRDEFVNIVEQDILQLMDILSNGVKEADKEYNTCTEKARKITDKYNDGMQALWNACNEAAGIPHWETHFFGSDRYEMTEAEGSQLIELLNEIATTKSDALADIYNEEMSAVAEEQQAYSDLVDLKASWQKIDDCLKEFKKTSKQLK